MNLLSADLDPLERLISAYAKRRDRQKYAFLFAFDSRLADILKGSSEILIAQIKLTWWRDILTLKSEQRPTGEPLVAAMNDLQLSDSEIEQLVAIVDGWECMLVDFPWDDRQFNNYAKGRGIGFYRFAFGADSTLTNDQQMLAQSWAYWDFARHCSDDKMRTVAFEKCTNQVNSSRSYRFDRNGRPLSILCKLVSRDVKKGKLSVDLYDPKTAIKIMWHGMTG